MPDAELIVTGPSNTCETFSSLDDVVVIVALLILAVFVESLPTLTVAFVLNVTVASVAKEVRFVISPSNWELPPTVVRVLELLLVTVSLKYIRLPSGAVKVVPDVEPIVTGPSYVCEFVSSDVVVIEALFITAVFVESFPTLTVAFVLKVAVAAVFNEVRSVIAPSNITEPVTVSRVKAPVRVCLK